MQKVLTKVVAGCFLALTGGAWADAADVLSKHTGYTIIETKTIAAFADRGKGKQDGFEGCDFDRIIIFTDGTGVRCTSYGYTYSYMPTAVILGKRLTYQGQSLLALRMVVGNESYDVHELK